MFGMVCRRPVIAQHIVKGLLVQPQVFLEGGTQGNPGLRQHIKWDKPAGIQGCESGKPNPGEGQVNVTPNL